jgi:shikimate dehydrogenase
LLAVLGDPVSHSLSPGMHNAAIRALGLDAADVALPTPEAALPAVLTTLSAGGAAGNVTVPHQESVGGLGGRKTDQCAPAGACNTVWTEHGVLVGDNTDVAGVRQALAALGADGAGRWLVLGTGGAARAVLVAAAEAKASLAVRSRDPDRARRFADWGAARGVRVEVVHGPLQARPADCRRFVRPGAAPPAPAGLRAEKLS